MTDPFTEKLNSEIDRRIALMEQESYENVPAFTGKDFILPGIAAVICTAVLILGYFSSL